MPTASSAADFAVLIPHYDDVVRLHRCLTALAAQDRSGTDIVVVDNGTPQDMQKALGDFPWVRLVTETAKGAAAARNCGVAQTSAPWLFFLDADCVPAQDWLSVARGIAQGDARTISGGCVSVFDETPPPRSGAEGFETVFAFDQESYIAKKGFSVTANLLTTRAVFEDVGPFVVGVSEDFDWCQRAVAAGYPLRYAPDLKVAHPTRSDWPALRKKWRRLTDESYGLTRGSGLRGKVIWGVRALAMPLSALAHVPRILRHPALSWSERGRTVATLIRLRCLRMIWMLRQLLEWRAAP